MGVVECGGGGRRRKKRRKSFAVLPSFLVGHVSD
jgi:hypothetical protein